ncbi:hypothetical protein PRZ48_012601 [Zasmidium cellare]|uniref:Uncharacterized protein n=1 Tax=Zasmidium cellare TaxID=395010 RepID=A0ABR0E5C3_ZASCE|nr:hypothetical protein PRZ48_012601 [Zasmidium cellare]
MARKKGQKRSPPQRPPIDYEWRLDDYYRATVKGLQESFRLGGIKVRRNATKAELLHEARRLALGRLNYKACTTKELTQFIKERGIQGPEGARKKKELVAVLEAADEEATFDRYLDLPTELREHVASYYMAELVSPVYGSDLNGTGVCMPNADEFELKEKRLSTPTQPPLTRTCRLLRKETLPLFYQTGTFDLGFNYSYRHPLLGPGGSAKLCDVFGAWLTAVGAEDVKSLRSLRVWISSYQPSHNFEYLLRTGEGVESCLEQWTQWDSSVDDHLVKELNQVLTGIKSREGARKFRIEDVDTIRKGIEAAFPLQDDKKRRAF